MSAIEIAILIIVGLFAVVLIFKLIFSKKKKAKEKKDDKAKEPEKKTEEPPKEEKAFKITKKGVAKISKKAINRDSRSGAIIEQAIVRGQPIPGEEQEENKKPGFEDFDALLDKLKSIVDPDDLDDETFRELFLSNSENDDFDPLSDDELSNDFVSLESGSGEIDRTLKHYTIDGNHLRLDQGYDGLPLRRPMIDTSRINFTERITGKYDNIRMGDVSNVLKLESTEDDTEIEEQEESDEEIFAKIMERRRRELGIDDPQKNTNNEIHEINARDIVIADAIMNPRFKKNKK